MRDRLSQQAGQQPLAVRKLAPAETPSAGSWTTLTNSPGVTLQNPLLLTDGTVIASQECTGNWYRLTPDQTGSYINGTWSQIASLPSGYAPLFHGSGVLPDGRVIIEGGEYNGVSGNCGSPVLTSKGAIYDPVANVWTSVSPPSGWSRIGDAESVILDNGTYMQSNCCDNIAGSYVAALLNATNLTWTATGTNKADRYDEEGFAKLHDGTVLDVDAHTSGGCGMNSEIYDPATGAWSSAGNTIHQQADCSNPGGRPSYELGPLVVRPDGSAVIFPGVTCSDVANTSCQNQTAGFVVTGTADIYTPGSGWASGPVIPTVGTAPNNYPYTLADAPAAVLPDGNVLFAASPSYQTFVAPTHFFELNFSNNTITQVGDTADAASCGAFVHNFLLLPSGAGARRQSVWQPANLHTAGRRLAGELGAGYHLGSEHSCARGELRCQRLAAQWADRRHVLRRRRASRDQLPLGANHQQFHWPRILRANVQPQHDVDRTERRRVDEFCGAREY